MSVKVAPEALMKHLNRYYRKHGAVFGIRIGKNLLGGMNFRVVEFTDGYVAVFCKREVDDTWFRNERKARR